LEPHVADLIAAGEVVERPASVIKELMENSIDAGAGIITVEITFGGMTYIRITDNGCGMSPEDAKTAFLRHATSKLRGADGLEAISTLGFRGEALAAIAAVSRIELLTRETGAAEGVSLMLEAGVITDMSPAGCPEGTTIIVRDLFFNTPARLKFMKSDRAESSSAASAALRTALSRPEVSVRFIRDGKTEYHTPGDSRIDSCIYSLFGREFSAGLLPAESSDDTIAVEGFVGAPSAARGNRSYQFFFVNARPIRSITLQAALERAYANNLPSGRFPSCALYITTKPCNVDVNVHPAKAEVKFASDKNVFDGVYYAALGAVTRSKAGSEEQKTESGKPEDGSARNLKFGAENAHNSKYNAFSTAPAGANYNSQPPPGHKRGAGFTSMQVDEYRNKYGIENAKPQNHKTSAPQNYQLPTDPQLSTVNYQLSTAAPLFRVIGETLNTYIIVEFQNGVWFIDKHAAHERIHFDALKAEGFEPMSQALITPVICRHGHEDVSVLLENAQLLDKLGFLVESFGEDALAVRRIPAEIDIEDAEPVLSDICTQLKHSGAAIPARHDGILRTIACKAAIKAGRSSSKSELETLAARVMSGEIAQCPHGRPVAFEITKATLDKGFKRI